MEPLTEKNNGTGTRCVSTKAALLWGVVVRCIFFAYSFIHEAMGSVPFTDIDFYVVMEGALLYSQGKSPYIRTTYRYTPFLAMIFSYPVFLHNPFLVKIVLVALDIAIGYMMCLIVKKLQNKSSLSLLSFFLWLGNPVVANISTRGSPEAVICFFVVLFVYLFISKRFKLSAVVLGFATHYKIFPGLFSIAVLCYFGLRSVQSIIRIFEFAFFAFISFVAPIIFYYRKFGFDFLYESYFYHIIRKDHRHNFSVYWLSIYLSELTVPSTAERILNYIPMILQLILIIKISVPLIYYKGDKNILFLRVLFEIVFVFVFFNKVVTVQYFTWFFVFLPLIIDFKHHSFVFYTMSFVALMGFWLFFGYLIEFQNIAVHFLAFLSSILFFIYNFLVFLPQIKRNLIT
ncbi:hypothetical protein PCE1_002306 [Barthelona sp. PCE]